MDISFKVNNEKFNYRVCAMIISDNKILAMHDERSPYFYLPGGRVELGETAEHAVVREVQEELCVTTKVIRPLCLYFLMDISETDILSRGNKFSLQEGNHTHDFEWLEFERLEKEYFYPLFLKKEIFHLPEKFTIRTECE